MSDLRRQGPEIHQGDTARAGKNDPKACPFVPTRTLNQVSLLIGHTTHQLATLQIKVQNEGGLILSALLRYASVPSLLLPCLSPQRGASIPCTPAPYRGRPEKTLCKGKRKGQQGTSDRRVTREGTKRSVLGDTAWISLLDS